MAGSAELHEPAVVHHAFDDGRREFVVGEDRAPSAELDVGGEYHVPPLMAVRYDLVQEPRPVHVEGHVAELVQDQEPRLGRVGEQPVERPLPLGLAELQHQCAICQNLTRWPAEVAAILRAVAMWILPRPVLP